MQARAADPMGFAISQVIPNRPIAQEVDRGRQREILRWLLLGGIVIGAALFNAWQRYGIVSETIRFGDIQTLRAVELQRSRHLQLDLETLKSPARIDALARQLKMVPPGPEDAVVLPRVVPAAQPPLSVVASR